MGEKLPCRKTHVTLLKRKTPPRVFKPVHDKTSIVRETKKVRWRGGLRTGSRFKLRMGKKGGGKKPRSVCAKGLGMSL